MDSYFWRYLMKLTSALITLCVAVPLISQERQSLGAQQTSPSTVTTSQDQQSLSVTIYNSSLGLVRDVRRITLPAGLSELKFMDVAAQINPATVHIKSVTASFQFRNRTMSMTC